MIGLFSWLNPGRWLLVAAAVAALVLGYFAWKDSIGDKREAEVVARYNEAALRATEASRKKEQELQATVTKAQTNAKIRQTKLQADANNLRAERYGLLEDIQIDSDGMVQAPYGHGLGAQIDFELIERKKLAVLSA